MFLHGMPKPLYYIHTNEDKNICSILVAFCIFLRNLPFGNLIILHYSAKII